MLRFVKVLLYVYLPAVRRSSMTWPTFAKFITVYHQAAKLLYHCLVMFSVGSHEISFSLVFPQLFQTFIVLKH